MPALVLELYLPISGSFSRDCASLSEALTQAGAYYAGFPAGWAEIRERATGRIVVAQPDLRAAFAVVHDAAASPSGAAIRLFGSRRP